MRRIVLGLFAVLLLVAGLATGADAHAVLLSVAPADGSVLTAQPGSVELHFNEPVTAGAVMLIDANGRTRDDARVKAAGDTVSVVLPAGLPKGSQVVSYRVISQDGHPVAGSMVFSIGTPSATVAPTGRNLWRDGLIWLVRVALYVGLFAGVGGAFVPPARTRLWGQFSKDSGMSARSPTTSSRRIPLEGARRGSRIDNASWRRGAARCGKVTALPQPPSQLWITIPSTDP